jgi:RNA recognition motif-containing protein
MNIYVGNLPFSTTQEELQQAFAAYGTVDTAKIITDRYSGRSRGFGFVEMPNEDEGRAAVEAMNDFEMGDRKLKVEEARPRED